MLDTNVIVSGLAFPERRQGQILWRMIAGQYQLLISDHLFGETLKTLKNPYFAALLGPSNPADLEDALSGSIRAAIDRPVEAIASHVEDDLVLATALSGNADVLVTGDKQLLKLGSFEGIRIVDSRAFLDMLDRETE